MARDASTAWLNPAGLTRLDTIQVLVGAQAVRSVVKFDPSSATTTNGSDGGDAGGWFPAGSLYLAVPVHERATLGLSLTAPYGLPLGKF